MQPNTSMKTHPLKHRHDRRREEVRGGYSQPSTYKQFNGNSHPKAYIDITGRKEMWWLLTAYNTLNDSIKTHQLFSIIGMIREKRYVHVVVTHSLIRKMKTHQLKDRRRERCVYGCYSHSRPTHTMQLYM